MDEHLKLLADGSMHVGAAEEAVGEGNYVVARDAVDAAAAILIELRERWPAMSEAERKIVGASAATVRARLDTVSAAIPKVSALSVGIPVEDPEQDSEPEAA